MNYLFPCGAIDISIYLEISTIPAILSSSGGMMKSELCEVILLVASVVYGAGDASITVQA